MILAFDIKLESLKSPNTFSRDMFSASVNEKVLIRPIGNTIYVMPPYILSNEETIKMGAAVRRALDQALA
jgi:adenosylmethionine-8-amino-7-oxononanoate aminotransferase